MPYVIERWPGGMLTNFPTIRKAVKKMATIDKLKAMVLIQTSLREKIFKLIVNVLNWTRT
jgi:small subunit ribosomal protein S2